LKEGLEGLPEVQDSVGVAFARLETAVTNSFSAFIRGFNENEKFAETLNNLATRVDFLTTKFENLVL
jgi:hypothetical protein